MHSRFITGVVMAAVGVLAICVRQTQCDEPEKITEHEAAATPQQARKVIERGLTFLEKDTVQWRQERGCATCHHGAMTIWALSEAKSEGYAVNAEALAEIMEWTKIRFVPKLDLPRDARPGWNLVSVPAI